MTNTTTAPRVPVHLEDVIVIDQKGPIVDRAYDYNAGDERRFDRAEAVELGRLRAIERGIRQQVRLTSSPIFGHESIWLIQDVR